VANLILDGLGMKDEKFSMVVERLIMYRDSGLQVVGTIKGSSKHRVEMEGI